jgi:site-specific DNA-cytosine methylase
MTCIALFAGIGGFDLVLNRLVHRCVYANEWGTYAGTISAQRFGHRPDTRSITDVAVDDIPDHDLRVGGVPCQTFSVAGTRRGFGATRGTLFFALARLLATKGAEGAKTATDHTHDVAYSAGPSSQVSRARMRWWEQHGRQVAEARLLFL